jgi:hypothetical protein
MKTNREDVFAVLASVRRDVIRRLPAASAPVARNWRRSRGFMVNVPFSA